MGSDHCRTFLPSAVFDIIMISHGSRAWEEIESEKEMRGGFFDHLSVKLCLV